MATLDPCSLLSCCLAALLGSCSATDPDVADDPALAQDAVQAEEADGTADGGSVASPSDGIGVSAGGEAEALASMLRPIDDPLPTRSQLDASFSDSLGILLRLTSDPAVEPLVRANAATELGWYPESAAAIERLFALATDRSASPLERSGALGGVTRLDAKTVDVDRLLPILFDPNFEVQAHAVLALGRFPAARPGIRKLLDDPETNLDVRRFAERALAEEAR